MWQNMYGNPWLRTQAFRSRFCLAALEKNQIFLQNCETKSGMESLGSRLGNSHLPSPSPTSPPSCVHNVKVEIDMYITWHGMWENIAKTTQGCSFKSLKYFIVHGNYCNRRNIPTDGQCLQYTTSHVEPVFTVNYYNILGEHFSIVCA